jgi:hypothetical protein
MNLTHTFPDNSSMSFDYEYRSAGVFAAPYSVIEDVNFTPAPPPPQPRELYWIQGKPTDRYGDLKVARDIERRKSINNLTQMQNQGLLALGANFLNDYEEISRDERLWYEDYMRLPYRERHPITNPSGIAYGLNLSASYYDVYGGGGGLQALLFENGEIAVYAYIEAGVGIGKSSAIVTFLKVQEAYNPVDYIGSFVAGSGGLGKYGGGGAITPLWSDPVYSVEVGGNPRISVRGIKLAYQYYELRGVMEGTEAGKKAYQALADGGTLSTEYLETLMSRAKRLSDRH